MWYTVWDVACSLSCGNLDPEKPPNQELIIYEEFEEDPENSNNGGEK